MDIDFPLFDNDHLLGESAFFVPPTPIAKKQTIRQ